MACNNWFGVDVFSPPTIYHESREIQVCLHVKKKKEKRK